MPVSSIPQAMVTGAGSGIGRQVAVQLAKAGYQVALLARSADALAATAGTIHATGAPAPRLLTMDLSQLEACQKQLPAALEEGGRLDVLVHCAGHAPLQPIPHIQLADYHQCLAVNLGAAIILAQAAWPFFQAAGKSVICNVSSMASLDPFTGFNLYGAAKAGVNTFTRALADEGRTIGLQAFAVAPGAVETPMLRQHFGPELVGPDQTLSPQAVAHWITERVTGRVPFENGTTVPLLPERLGPLADRPLPPALP